MDPRFLSIVETTMRDVSQLWFIVFYLESGEPIASASLSTFRVYLTVVATPRIRRLIKTLRRFAPSLLHVNILFGGLPISLGQKNLLFTPEADTTAVVARLDDIIADVTKQHHVWFIVFRDFHKEDLDDLHSLLARGYRLADSLGIHIFD